MIITPSIKLEEEDLNKLREIFSESVHSVGPGKWEQYHTDIANEKWNKLRAEAEMIAKQAFILGFNHASNSS